MYYSSVIFILSWAVVYSKINPEFEAYKREHAEEFSGKFEGDIVISDRASFRNALVGLTKWPNGIVYYDVSLVGKTAQKKIRASLKSLEARLQSNCIQFKERTNEANYIRIINARGCYSKVGMTGGMQDMSLDQRAGCLNEGIIQHEFLHALGFIHEQSRSDRDEYITINWENIHPTMINNFNRDNTNNLDLPYTYGSLMHYGKYAFSANGRPTMEPKDRKAKIGSRKLHDRDVLMVQKYYGCPTTVELRYNEKCVDNFDSCKTSLDFCKDDSYKDYMKKNCAKSCGFCSGQSTSGSGTEVTQPTWNGKCVDNFDTCKTSLHFCEDPTYSGYMKVNCPKACGYCGSNNSGVNTGGSTTGGSTWNGKCVDNFDTCKTSLHFCEDDSYKGYMKTNCPKSCGYC
ncbi:hatching enzyme 1.2-like [Tubulanus polymorphus]|uniref:hatching enzyme 1.2-like n=1 Tax=Tubulanus polymorphus TaxID=672921 RepID=UPI003DA3F570